MNKELYEQSLLQGLARSDKKAVETIYKDHFNMVQALVVHNNGAPEDAKDIFQETMVVLFEKSRSGKLELSCQLKTFIYSISRRLWLKRLMQQNRFIVTEPNEEVVAVDDDIEEHDKRNAEFLMMEKAMGGLGEPCKSLLEAYYIRKRSMQEISQDFGYTNAENAKNQKYKCLMRLRKLFFAQYKNEPL